MVLRLSAVLTLLLALPWISSAQFELADAAEEKKWGAVSSLLSENTNPDAVQEDGTSALHWAAYHNHFATIERLIKAGADVTLKNRFGATALSQASVSGNAVAVSALLEAGADANTTLPGGETVLMTAARTGKLAPIDALLKHGAKLDSTDFKKQTALMWAAAEGHASVIDNLIQAGADPNRATKSGMTSIMFAARNGHIEAVQMLMKNGVDHNKVIEIERQGRKAPPKGSGPLRFAVENGHFDLAIVLLEAGANPNDQRSGHTPLHVLSWVRKPNRGDGDDGAPPPEGSGKTSSLNFARILVERFKADPNTKLDNGTAGGHRLGTRGATPALLAAKTGDLPFLKLLVELGADIAIPNGIGTTPLMTAAGLGTSAPTEEAGTEAECIETVAWLLERGAKINYLNENGEGAMHGAAYKNLPAMVEFLHEKGADIKFWNLKNKRGHTPLLIAQGFRPGNFKPAPATIAAMEKVMRANGVEPPPAPKRPVVGRKQKYDKN